MVNTNTIFLKDRKPNDRFDFRKLSNTPREPLEGSFYPMEDVPEITTSPFLDTREPRRSERIIRAPNWFMFLGEFVFDKHDLDPNNYNEAIFNKNLRNW